MTPKLDPLPGLDFRNRPTMAALLGACTLAVGGLLAVWLSFTVRLQEAKRGAEECAARPWPCATRRGGRRTSP